MDIELVKKEIENWIINFVEKPNELLNGWPPCPYARRARIEKQYDVRLGSHPLTDLVDLSYQGIAPYEVVILVYNPDTWDRLLFSDMLEQANLQYLLSKDLIVLEDHPDDLEMVNGVCMNQGTYALALVQSKSQLDSHAQAVARKGFYNGWPEHYLQGLFKHRQDPRQ